MSTISLIHSAQPEPSPEPGTARQVICPLCWAPRGKPCTIMGSPGDHLARWQRAETDGLLSRSALATVVAGLTVIAAAAIVPECAA